MVTPTARAVLAGALVAIAASSPATAEARPFKEALGNAQSIQCQPASREAVRIIIPQWLPVDTYLSCARSATAAGHRLVLVFQYRNCAPVKRIRQRFRRVLRAYPRPWAFAIGNEQELSAQGGLDCPLRAPNARRYSRVWRALEPILKRREPHALRVAGEVSPWGASFVHNALQDGLPGAQVISAHVYPLAGEFPAAQFVTMAHEDGMQAWADEGMCGAGAWSRYGCFPAKTLKAAGFTLGGEWYAPGQPAATPYALNPGQL